MPTSVLTYLPKYILINVVRKLNDVFTNVNLLSQQHYGFRNNNLTSLANTDLKPPKPWKLISCAIYSDLLYVLRPTDFFSCATIL